MGFCVYGDNKSTSTRLLHRINLKIKGIYNNKKRKRMHIAYTKNGKWCWQHEIWTKLCSLADTTHWHYTVWQKETETPIRLFKKKLFSNYLYRLLEIRLLILLVSAHHCLHYLWQLLMLGFLYYCCLRMSHLASYLLVLYDHEKLLEFLLLLVLHIIIAIAITIIAVKVIVVVIVADVVCNP